VRAAGRRNPIAWRITKANKLVLAGKYARAERKLAGVVAELEAIHADEPDDAEAVVLLAGTSHVLGVCQHRLGRNEEAAAALRLSRELLTPLHAADGAVWGRQLASAVVVAATVERDLGHWPQALELSRRALHLWTELPGERWAPYKAYAMRTFAHVRAGARAELDEALQQADASIAAYTAVLATTNDERYRQEIDVSQLARTMVLEAIAQPHTGADRACPS
jgi:tetratricopeptide (TPR) repeat protein